MPSIQDFSEDEDELRSKGGGASSGGGGAVLAQASPQRESEFTPWSRFVSANKDVAQTEAGKLTQRVTNDANAVKSATDKATGDFTKGIESNYSHFGDEAEGGFGGATPSSPRGEAVRTQAQQETTGGGIFGNEPTGFGASGAREVGKEAPTKHSARSPGPLPQDTEPYGAGAPIARPGGLEQITAGAQESTRTGLKPGALDAQPGPKDLEGMLGTDAWSKLIGQTVNASNEANALGSESGVQGLIQKSASGPLAQGGAFDAALEYGEGQKDFGALNKQYGKGQLAQGLANANEGAQGAWHRLMGDIDNAKLEKQAKLEADEFNNRPKAQPEPEDTANDLGDQTLNDLLFGDGQTENFWSTLHQAGLSMSPADWASIAAGEAGTDTPMPTEEFSKGVSGGLSSEIQKSWPPAKFKMAWGFLSKQYPASAMAALAKYLGQHPDIVKQYLAMKNPGFMAMNLRQLVESMGFAKGGQSGVHLSSQTDLDSLREELSRGHWVTDPTTGKRYDTIEDWDKDHRPK